jgi:undecaprenyl-diphosphatase
VSGAETPGAHRLPWLVEAGRIDRAVYDAVGQTCTPTLDHVLQSLSNAADHSKLWLATAALLSVAGGASGRRAAAQGLASVAMSSALVNLVAKQVGRRPRPQRSAAHRAAAVVSMPSSTSFPSGHSASAFAFATGVAARLPATAMPLHALAGAVAYSRVHTGVHYPGDVLVGSVLGTVIAQLTSRSVRRYFGWSEAAGPTPNA